MRFQRDFKRVYSTLVYARMLRKETLQFVKVVKRGKCCPSSESISWFTDKMRERSTYD